MPDVRTGVHHAGKWGQRGNSKEKSTSVPIGEPTFDGVEITEIRFEIPVVSIRRIRIGSVLWLRFLEETPESFPKLVNWV
jgi:hypothetical protein